MDDTITLPTEGPSSLLNLTGSSTAGVSPLEQDVLDEYERLARNMETLSNKLSSLASSPDSTTLEIADGLRHLERKVASVYTLMKASVYSIVLQQGEGETDLSESVVGGQGEQRR